jgi:hypothetical protein
MSTADEWDLTVPEDAAELMAELRRRGVVPGQRVHIGPAAELAVVRNSAEPERPKRLSFTGAIHAEADLSTNTDRYLDGFGR